MTIRVLIVDNDSLVRRALVAFIGGELDMEVVGEEQDGIGAVSAVGRLKPDVVLMDLQMPRMGGVDATAEIVRQWPTTRVMAVTTFGTIDAILPALQAGASGYLLKDAEPDDLIAAVRSVHTGSGVLSPQITERLLTSIQDSARASVPLTSAEMLSEREREVVQLLGTGKSNLEIADAMHVSEGTVKSHLSNVMTKWVARDRVQVLIRAARAGIIDFR